MSRANLDRQILRDAKALIEKRGWRSGSMHSHNAAGYPIFEYPLCVYDAIIEAGGLGAGRAVQIMRCTVAPNAQRGMAIIDWNDERSRTVEQVYTAFDKAIAT